jgi:hypothetical protein
MAQQKERSTLANTLMLSPSRAIELGTPKHDAVVKVLEQIYYTETFLSSERRGGFLPIT